MNAKLNDIVTRAFNETWSTMESRDVSMRLAAYGLAVQRVAEATVTRGIYPLSVRSSCTTRRAATSANGREGSSTEVRKEVPFELEEIEIDGDPELEARYREWLPVVEIDGERAFVYYVDPDAFRRKVAAQS